MKLATTSLDDLYILNNDGYGTVQLIYQKWVTFY